MSSDAVAAVRAREVYDSRGKPTVEAEVVLAGGARGWAMVPSGASTGRHEAVELRDGGPRLRGLGVRRAVAAVHEVLAPAVAGFPAGEQGAIDAALCAADGTPDRSRLGANALLAVSMAVARASAAHAALPLWRRFADLSGAEPLLPLPMVNVFSGGLHAGGGVDVQDYLFVPLAADGVAEAIEQAVEVRLAAGDLLRERGLTTLLADEGGFGPPLPTNSAALDLLVDAMARAGMAPGSRGGIALDLAASHLARAGGYALPSEGVVRSGAEMVALVARWAATSPVVSVEDPLGEDDWAGWRQATADLGGRLQVVGDDLFVTQEARLRRGIAERVANAVLVKCNQVGTVSETLAVVALARRAGYAVVVSARSGETEDPWLADLAVGTGAGQIKVGATRTSERTSKYNRLLRIAEEMGSAARFAGRAALAGEGGASAAGPPRDIAGA